MKKGQRLKVIDIEGEQVCDFICFNRDDTNEQLSSGRTIDYAGTISLTTGNPFYSNRSKVMFSILEDTVGRHDFLLAPCSSEMFRIIYGHTEPHRGCLGNLAECLKEYGITADRIPVCFNIFMNVTVDGKTGKVDVCPPRSRAGDYIVIEANMDLIVGLTACAAGASNNFSYKPIGFQIQSEAPSAK
jgi:uncharacterized protein YcgI (DUF1989 family)